MRDNTPVIIVLLVVLAAALVFVIVRNRKDEKEFENEMAEEDDLHDKMVKGK